MSDSMNREKIKITEELISKFANIPQHEDIKDEILEELRVTLRHITQRADNIMESVEKALELEYNIFDYTEGDLRYAEALAFEKFRHTAIVSLEGVVKDLKLSERLSQVESSTLLGQNIPSTISNDKIFIVHGRDDLMKMDVARFVEKIGLEAIILHEQSHSSATIIESFEKYSDVGFAIILYTPCDIGKLASDEELQPRARQNVVFEHGYFIGKLGRENVAVLYKDNVELPSDITGLLHTKYSHENPDGWKISLARDMQASGFDVDFNKLFIK